METLKQTSREYFRTLSIIHMALVGGLVICTLFILLLLSVFMEKEIVVDMSSVFIYIISIVVLGGIALGILLYKSRLEILIQSRNLSEKMSKYRDLLILKYVLQEGPAMLSILLSLITHNLIFLFFALLNIGLLILWRPSKSSVIRELQLKQYEVDIIENPQSIIAESEIAND
jgi:hypothetical protein